MNKQFKMPYFHTAGQGKITGEIKDGALTSDTKRRLMTSIASGSWGEINDQDTIVNNQEFMLMNFSCSGHGGYILISPKEIPVLGSAWCKGSDYTVDWMPAFFLYMLEEDCEWAKLYLVASPSAWAKVETFWRGSRTTTTTLKEYALSSLKSYYPHLLPTPTEETPAIPHHKAPVGQQALLFA